MEPAPAVARVPAAGGCPGCARGAEGPPGAIVHCGGCGTDYWALPLRARGEPFQVLDGGPAGLLGAAWAAVAAAGTLVALTAVAAAEVWLLVLAVRWAV